MFENIENRPCCYTVIDMDYRREVLLIKSLYRSLLPNLSAIKIEGNPNLLVKLTRESQWAELYPEIMGPTASFLYFGPSQTPGYIVYGNGPSIHMTYSMRQKKDSST
jgi:hypothetical protein